MGVFLGGRIATAAIVTTGGNKKLDLWEVSKADKSASMFVM